MDRATPPRDVARDLAEFVATVDTGALADGDVDATKRLVLDTLACTIAGSGEPPAAALLELYAQAGGNEQATVAVHGARLPVCDAVMVNSAMARALDLDDVHEQAILHTGVHVVPAALALAEHLGDVAGPDLLAAIAIGQDVMIRLSLACETPPVLRGRPGTYVFGTFATAAVAARLFRMDQGATADAFGNAYARAAGTTLGYQEGAVGQRAMQGLSASAGVFAAMLARAGIGGMGDCLEGQSGYYAVHEEGRYDRSVLTDGLGHRFHGTETALKPYPVHRGAVIDLEAALEVARRHEYDPAHIEAVRVRFPARFSEGIARIRAFDPDRAVPVGPVAPHFSSSWAVAVGLVNGRARIADFTEAGVERLCPRVGPVARTVTGIPDPALDEGCIGLGPRLIEVDLADGTSMRERVDDAPGGPARPWTWGDVVGKLEDCAPLAVRPLAPGLVEELVDAVANLDGLHDSGVVPRLLGRR